jgi:type II secretory pathway component PulF
VLLILALFPLVLAIVRGSLASMRRQDEAGGSLAPVDTLVEEIGRSNVSLLPASLAAIILLVSGLFVWNSMPLQAVRHRASLGIPFLAGRARAEAMARFAWAMQMLSRSGLPPVIVFKAAAGTIPNIVLRDRLLSAAEGMGEKERLSEALKRARFLPEEHELIIANGEFVGDVPGALGAVASAQEEEFRTRDSSAVHRVGCMVYPLIGLMVLMMLVYLWSMWYEGLFKLLLDG